MKILKKANLVALVACLGFTACVQGVQVQKITTPKVDVPILASANPAALKRKKNGTVVQRYTHDLRTFVTQNGKTVEVVGAACTLQSKEIQAKVTTPVQLGMPMLNRVASPTLTIRCSKDGLEGSAALPLQFLDAAPTANPLSAVLAKGIAKGLDRYTYGFGKTQYMSVLLK